MPSARRDATLPAATLDWAEQATGLRFHKPARLAEALTHASTTGANYERLEFLGDRVLGMMVAEWLFERHPRDSEGLLARRYAELVRREVCAAVARAIGAAAHIRVEAAAGKAGMADSDSVLGDVCEALIGAVYLEGGVDAARAFIRRHWADSVASGAGTAPKDVKNALQEWAQGQGRPLPAYTVVDRAGPDHAPRFVVEVNVTGEAPVRAEGTTKQDAQKKAAAAMLDAVQRKTGGHD